MRKRVFFHSKNYFQSANSLRIAANFSELLPRKCVRRQSHCQTLCSNFVEWVTSSPPTLPFLLASFGTTSSQRSIQSVPGVTSTSSQRSIQSVPEVTSTSSQRSIQSVPEVTSTSSQRSIQRHHILPSADMNAISPPHPPHPTPPHLSLLQHLNHVAWRS